MKLSRSTSTEVAFAVKSTIRLSVTESHTFARYVKTFAVSSAFSPVPADHILRVGIVLQGLISSDGARVTYGKILNCTGLTVDSFTKISAVSLPYDP